MSTTYYKVIMIQIDHFESTITDERHFPTRGEAEQFASDRKKSDIVPLIATMTY